VHGTRKAAPKPAPRGPRKQAGLMRNYIAILEHEQADDEHEPAEHGELCCLIQAESIEDIEEPLAALVARLRAETDALQGVKHVLLVDIIELPGGPGNAVLWSSSWTLYEGHGFASVRGRLLLDESGSGEAFEWVREKNKADRAANSKTASRRDRAPGGHCEHESMDRRGDGLLACMHRRPRSRRGMREVGNSCGWRDLAGWKVCVDTTPGGTRGRRHRNGQQRLWRPRGSRRCRGRDGRWPR
jgi:hypothetical protein